MLTKEKRRPICGAILKYGHNNFTLKILEYCSISKLIEREQSAAKRSFAALRFIET
jgi:hypothetical protein